MKKIILSTFVFTLSFISLANEKNENSTIVKKDCGTYASSMMNAIETHYGCIENSNDYNAAYNLFYSYCNLLSAAGDE